MSTNDERRAEQERAARDFWARRAGDVAAQMTPEGGRTWQAVEHRSCEFIITNAVISFRYGVSSGSGGQRATVRDNFDYQDLPRGVGGCSITQSTDKDAKAAARDIEKRLLPQIREIAERVRQIRQREDEERRGFAAAVESLNEAGGGFFLVKTKDHCETEGRIVRGGGESRFHWHGEVTATSAHIHFQSLTHDELAVVFRALVAHRAFKRGEFAFEGACAQCDQPLPLDEAKIVRSGSGIEFCSEHCLNAHRGDRCEQPCQYCADDGEGESEPMTREQACAKCGTTIEILADDYTEGDQLREADWQKDKEGWKCPECFEPCEDCVPCSNCEGMEMRPEDCNPALHDARECGAHDDEQLPLVA